MLLQPVSCIGIEISEDLPLNKQYEVLRNESKRIIVNTVSLKCIEGKTSYWKLSEQNYLTKIWNTDIIKAVEWANRNIILNLGLHNYRTIEVMTRIFTGMLYKCDVDKEILIKIHDNFVRNVREEHYKLINEDLPF